MNKEISDFLLQNNIQLKKTERSSLVKRTFGLFGGPSGTEGGTASDVENPRKRWQPSDD
jgi:hypothetical protein